jgi:flagellar hook-associated protein 2
MSTSPIDVSSLLQAFGLNSGSTINTSTIVSELMQVNEEPLTTMQNAVTADQTDISAYGSILSSVSSLESAVKAMQNSTVGVSATSSNPSYFTATAASGATVGTDAIDIKNLATAQSIYSPEFASASTAVATGSLPQQLKIQVGSNAPVTITVGTGGATNTLSGIATAINNANAGVSASVLQVSDGNYVLALTSNATGSSNRITVTVDESGSNFGTGWLESANVNNGGLSQLAFDPLAPGLGGSYNSSTGIPSGGYEGTAYNAMTQSTAAVPATLSVNGIQIQSQSNEVTNAVAGVTLNLLQADPSYSASSPNFSLNMTASSDSLSNQLSSFVSAYNTAMSTINSYYQPPAQNSTSSSSSSQQGLLGGDNILLTLSNTLQDVTTNPYGTGENLATNSLSYLGLSHDSDGTLTFDSSQLSTAYQTDSANITTIVNNMASQFGAVLNNYIQTTIPAEQSGYQTQVTNLQSQETTLQQQLTYEQTALTNEYSALSSLVTSDNQVSSFLTEETDFQDQQNAGGA